MPHPSGSKQPPYSNAGGATCQWNRWSHLDPEEIESSSQGVIYRASTCVAGDISWRLSMHGPFASGGHASSHGFVSRHPSPGLFWMSSTIIFVATNYRRHHERRHGLGRDGPRHGGTELKNVVLGSWFVVRFYTRPRTLLDTLLLVIHPVRNQIGPQFSKTVLYSTLHSYGTYPEAS